MITYIPLRQCIMHLDKADIQDNAAMFGEELLPSLSKKAMALRLSEIYIQNTAALLPMLSLTAAVYLHLIFKSDTNGQLEILNESTDKKYSPFNALHKQLEYLGLIHYCDNRFYVTDILRSVVADIDVNHLDPRLIAWQQMEACALGIISAYGMLEDNTFSRIFCACYPDLCQKDAAVFLKRRLAVVTGCPRISIMNKLWRLSALIDDPESWYSVLKAKETLPRKEYTRDDYLQFSADGLSKKPENFDALTNILTKTGISRHDAEEMLWCAAIDQCCQLHAHSQLPHMILNLVKNNPVKAAQVMNLCTAFVSDIPLWINKGHTIQQCRKMTSWPDGPLHSRGPAPEASGQRSTRNRNVILLKTPVSHQKTGHHVP